MHGVYALRSHFRQHGPALHFSLAGLAGITLDKGTPRQQFDDAGDFLAHIGPGGGMIPWPTIL
jgi:hypothetical protein